MIRKLDKLLVTYFPKVRPPSLPPSFSLFCESPSASHFLVEALTYKV